MSREDEDGNSLTLNEKEVLYKLLPIAFIFMCLVFGASTVSSLPSFTTTLPSPSFPASLPLRASVTGYLDRQRLTGACSPRPTRVCLSCHA